VSLEICHGGVAANFYAFVLVAEFEIRQAVIAAE
jgi:hypothetical protein